MAYVTTYGEMMTVGPYSFGLTTAAYNALNIKNSWRWTKVDRLGVKPASQFIGPDATTMTFKGVIYPEFPGNGGPMVGTYQVDAMREAANQGQPLYVTDGRGNVYGQFVITEIEEDQSIFVSHGAPRKQEFTVTLQEYGDDGASTGFNFAGGFDMGLGLLSGLNPLGILSDVASSAVADLVGSVTGSGTLADLAGDVTSSFLGG